MSRSEPVTLWAQAWIVLPPSIAVATPAPAPTRAMPPAENRLMRRRIAARRARDGSARSWWSPSRGRRPSPPWSSRSWCCSCRGSCCCWSCSCVHQDGPRSQGHGADVRTTCRTVRNSRATCAPCTARATTIVVMRWRFGGFELDTARAELRRDGEIVQVEPQVFDVLRTLIEHRDRVVTHRELNGDGLGRTRRRSHDGGEPGQGGPSGGR